METAPVPRKTHPMILVAAAAVTTLSVAGTASLLGWLPTHSDAPAQVAQQASSTPAAQNEAPAAQQQAPAAAAEPKPRRAAPPAPARSAAPSAPVASREAAPPTAHDSAPRPTRVATQPVNDNGIYVENARPAPAQAATVCPDCGTVESVREIKQKGEGTGLGAVAGGVIGGLLGNQVGGGNGKKAMTVVGAAGGAFAGHEAEKHLRGDKQYEVTVRFDDGRTRSFTETQAPQYHDGDRVRLANGRLVAN